VAGAAQADADYIRDLVRRGDRDRFWAALLAPEPARADLLALYAFNLELARIAEQVSEPQLGEIRLQWWSETLSASLGGEATDHPVLSALAAAALRHKLDARVLDGMIEARSFDLYDDLMPDFAALDAYLTATAGAVFHLGAQILGGGELPSLSPDAATAYGLTGLMRALPYHASRGKIFLPQCLLSAHGLHPSAILHGSDNEDLRAALRAMRERASQALANFRREAAGLPRRLRPAFLPVALVGPYLKRLAAWDHHPLREIVQINPLKRYGLIWRGYVSGKF
jgi:phytoene synthase